MPSPHWGEGFNFLLYIFNKSQKILRHFCVTYNIFNLNMLFFYEC